MKRPPKRTAAPRILGGVILAGLLLAAAGCEGPEGDGRKGQTVRTVRTRSAGDLLALFDELGYTKEAWRAGIRELPRIQLASIPERWRKASQEMPVERKKEIFFRLAAPAVLIANERIEGEKRLLERLIARYPDWSEAGREQALALARRYKVIPADRAELAPEDLEELKLRVDTIPVSLALAQAAEESGWGTSRFAVLGNALFGQWDFSGRGMVPEKQRKELGNYGLARFDSPQESVDAYMLNLNTHPAYARLRARRAEMRKAGAKPSGYELAETLERYSERGEAYVKALHDIMRINRLAWTDDASLWRRGLIRVEPIE